MESDDYLLISGLQHFAFCRRQWALIHIEQQWSENLLTAEGRIVHERVHDINSSGIRGGILTLRDLPVKSEKMRVTGCCDAVEFIPCESGITLNGRDGQWRICPVEYKRGHYKINDCDRLQAAAQAMCLEEMFSCEITEGAVFYHETRKREKFEISSELRENVLSAFREMHDLYSRGYTPKVKKHEGCKSCSLKELCLPSLQNGKGFSSVGEYMRISLKEEDDR